MLKADYSVAPTDIDLLVFEKLIPADHYLRRLKAAIDFEPFRVLVADCYVEGVGAPAADPVRLLKLSLLQFQYDLSDSQVLRQAQVNVAFRFFLDLSVESPLPVPSLLSQFRTRLGEERFTRVCNEILGQARAQGLVKDRLRLKVSYQAVSATPNRVLKTDPRADPRLVAACAPFALDLAPPPVPVTAASPLQDKLAYSAANEAGMEAVFAALFADLPPIPHVERRTEVIKGVDGNDITLYIHTPQNVAGPLPCVYHLHGGGMVVLTAAGPTYRRWRDELAALGMVVVGVEFRNGAGKLGNHPFPAGLNDCMSGLQWTCDHKAPLGISKIVVSGESGGGNLTLAVCLRAKKDNRLEQIAGVYALCPYIYGAWAQKSKELPSLIENNAYLINCSLMEVFASVYDPEHTNATNPLCWPYWATREDLHGLTPHVISVNELDPLRDEGLKYYQMLMAAGVRGYSRTVNGTCHAGDVLFRTAIPDMYAATLRDIKGFADSLRSGGGC